MSSTPPSPARIARFWAPLAATWLMMAAEGPFLAALVARLPAPTLNLAAFGVALSFGMLIEAPVIMMLSAATALVRDRASLCTLRRFSGALNAGVTLLMLGLLVPPVFHFVTEHLIGLPPEVARLAHVATALLLPWPAAIGYRRFYQGVLIAAGLTRRVAYGTVVRVASMAATGAALFFFGHWPGACVATLALTVGVGLEAAATRIMARQAVREVGAREGVPGTVALTTPLVVRFYAPLALTSLVALGAHPLVTFLVAHSRMALESLAILPVVTGLTFVFRSGGIAYQEVCIVLLGDDRRGQRPLAWFGLILGLTTSAALALLAFTPAGPVWLQHVAGVKAGLAHFALLPLRVLVLTPPPGFLLTFQRPLPVPPRRTPPITWATGIEVAGIAVVIAVLTGSLDVVGAAAAAGGLAIGRLAANAFLCRVLRPEGLCPTARRS
jgi:progressive ankylosis protein